MAGQPTRSPRVAVVTGASAGVGRAVARAFAAQGDAVGLIARGEAGLEAAAREITGAGGRAMWVTADIADAGAVEAAAERIEAELGQIDVWVNNAMVTVLAPVHEMASEDFRRVTELTFLGVVYGTQAALRRMLPRDAGVIVQVRSALAYRGIPLQSAYCSAKHAIQGFSDSLRCELLHDGSHDGATAGAQHPAIHLDEELPSAQAAARATHLPTRDRRRCHRVGSRQAPTRGQRCRNHQHVHLGRQADTRTAGPVPHADCLFWPANARTSGRGATHQPLAAG